MTKKIALITGSASGIGFECARKFATNGFAVCGVDLKFPSEIYEFLISSGGLVFEQDVTLFQKAHEACQTIVSRLENIHALITCAGISQDATISKLSEGVWDKVIDIDLKGTFNYISAVSSVFQKQNFGKIVTIASTVALRARRGLCNYSAAKAGVIGLTRACARDLGKYNVNANCVAPGLVETPLTEKIPQDIKNRLLEETCIGRIATPVDIANVVYFLTTEEARHITGEVIRVDGGQLA